MDITLRSPELAEALQLYLESRGLVVQKETNVVVRDDGGELKVEITGVSLGEIRRAPDAQAQPVARQSRLLEAPTDDPAPVSSPRARSTSEPARRMVTMPDASDWKEGQLDPAEVVAIPADRFRVDPVPPGEAPTARALARPGERVVPVHNNDGVAEEFQVHPVEGLLSNVAAGPLPGERGSMTAMPDDF